MTVLKVCGLLPGDDLSFAGSVATHVGFVFVPASRRFVKPEAARDMIEELGGRATAVGVFVDDPMESILTISRTTGIQVAQLHGSESPEYCAGLRESGLGVWKSMSMPYNIPDVGDVVTRMMAFIGHVDAILLDAAPPKTANRAVTGGHGVSFNWSLLPKVDELLHEQARGRDIPPLWIAGGITPENAVSLLTSYRPSGVDVSSGVEVEGRKSLQKIKAMIEAVEPYV